MNLTLTLTADSAADAALIGRLIAALGPQPAAAVVAPPAMPKIEAVPAPPLSPEVKAELDKREAAVEEPVKRKPGRPPSPETAARRAAEAEAKLQRSVQRAAKEWSPPVPRPESGLYGKQEADPNDPTWEAKRADVRQRLKVVLTALNMAGLDHQKFLTQLMVRYGDGKMLSTVPQGNLDAMVAEAEAGPADRPLTKSDLEAAAAQLEAEAGAA